MPFCMIFMQPVKVTAAIIEKAGRYLIARRKAGSLAGKWEFPGGKQEMGESPEDCLRREILEELSMEIEVGGLFIAVSHEYSPTKRLLLQAFCCRYKAGDVGLQDHDDFAWVAPAEMGHYDFADADKPIIAKLLERRTAE
jgi:8-oxo-dGTP diphosphatase